MSMRIASKRLGKELMEIQTNGPPTGTKVLKADDLKEWTFELQVLGSSVYEGETFAMRFRFTDNYPLEAPEVVFVTTAPYRSPVVSKKNCGLPFLSFALMSSLLTYTTLSNSIPTSTPMDTAVLPSFRLNGVPYSMSVVYS
jgi:hypothetical protein